MLLSEKDLKIVIFPRTTMTMTITSSTKLSNAARNMKGLFTSHKYGLKSETLIALGASLIKDANDPSNSPRVYPDPASFPVQ